jgi:hypothetical protein
MNPTEPTATDIGYLRTTVAEIMARYRIPGLPLAVSSAIRSSTATHSDSPT